MRWIRPGMVALALAAAVTAAAQSRAPVWAIQGTGMVSPYQGEEVVTGPAVVTAVGPAGFFMQVRPADADGDPESSDGLYVYTGATPGVGPGDLVEVTGTVQEYHGMTEISGSPSVTVLGTGEPLPGPVVFDAGTPSPDQPWPETEFERFEGMRVAVPSGMVCGPSDTYGDAVVRAVPSRAFREPGIPYPGRPGLPVWDGNPELFELDPDALGLPDEPLAAGSLFSATGVLAYAWGAYQLWPTELEVNEAELPRPAPSPAEGAFRVATQNLHRLFDAQDDAVTDDDVPAPEDLDLQLGKLARQVLEVLGVPEVVAVQEVENESVLAALAVRISALAPGVSYQAFVLDGNDPSGLDVGFLVRAGVRTTDLEQLGASAVFSYSGSTYTTFDRPPLLLEVALPTPAGGGSLVLVGVHLRSMLGIEGDSADFVRRKRAEQAAWLAAWIQGWQEEHPGGRLMVLGDFNAYPFSDGYVDVLGEITGQPDPAGALYPAVSPVDPPLVNTVLTLPAEERYSFVRDGSAAALDHALVTGALAPLVAATVFPRGACDAPVAAASDGATPLRASDHDGLVVDLGPDADGDGVADPRDNCPGTANPGQEDGDLDGLGDACDSCVNPLLRLGPDGPVVGWVTPPECLPPPAHPARAERAGPDREPRP